MKIIRINYCISYLDMSLRYVELFLGSCWIEVVIREFFSESDELSDILLIKNIGRKMLLFYFKFFYF